MEFIYNHTLHTSRHLANNSAVCRASAPSNSGKMLEGFATVKMPEK